MSKSRTPHVSVLADDRGSYQAEYTMVLVLVALAVVAALATLGVPLVLYHRAVQATVTAPVP